jgi:hypothetical protein
MAALRPMSDWLSTARPLWAKDILPMSMLIRVALSGWVPAAAASFLAAKVVLLVLPAPQPQLMVVRCVV